MAELQASSEHDCRNKGVCVSFNVNGGEQNRSLMLGAYLDASANITIFKVETTTMGH